MGAAAGKQADPRAKVIELLAGYGDKAKKGAIPVLQAVLKSDDCHDKAQHGKAREILAKFGVILKDEG
jgi:hypothetical protein